jgi:Ca2+:H+ antiporter
LTVGSALAYFLHAPSVAAFVISAVGLAILAVVVGRSVDGLGDRLGPGMTGVVQSALGNLPELFISVFALRAGLLVVVQSALVGSILANVLLVLGIAFVAGGLRHGTQRFAAEGARTVALLLFLAVAVLIVPTVTSELNAPAAHHEVALSNVAAVVLLCVYGLSIAASVLSRRRGGEVAGGGEAPHSPWPLWVVLTALLVSSVAAAFVSEWFIDALTPAIKVLHISEAFAGLVIVAIAGNAVENVVGVRLAAQDKMDYALSIILQSPVQIALALFPILVLFSPVIGGATLTLVLPPLLVVVLALSAVITILVVFDGESNWLEGACLVGLYAVVATAFWWG